MSSDFTFLEMPDLNDQHKEYVDRDSSFFTGEPQRKLKQPKEGEDEEPEEIPQPSDQGSQEGEAELNDDVSVEEDVKVPPKELTEIDRLKYVVLAIENDCQVAPLGAFKMTCQHQVRRNEAFRGLTSAQSLSLDNYVHFRNVQNETNKVALDRPDAPFNNKFLESISQDLPRGTWNFQHSPGDARIVLGRNLIWPGFHCYHVHNQNKFGSVYIGDGLKNLEL